MSPEQGTKQFEPTRSRLEKARRDGDVPRSSEFSGAVAFAAALCGLCLALPGIAGAARAEILANAAHPLSASGAGFASAIAWGLVPAVCAAAGGGISAISQGRGLHLTALSFKAERLDPVAGLKRMFSREAAVTSARAIVAVVCAAAVLLPTVLRLLSAATGAQTAQTLAASAFAGALTCGFLVAATGALFGGADFALVFMKWKNRLRMSFEELKREHKEQDGDPAAKGRRRSMHRELSRSSVQRVKEAAFVVVNPTHVAVAVEYRPPHVHVPRVLLRAADESALRVREAALRLGIPLVENIALARTLYATARTGEYIPKETYIAVAEIVAALVKSGAIA